MEELLNDYYENIDDPFTSTDNAMAIIDKVGYFVNRVQELEGDKKAMGDLVEKIAKTAWDIEQQNNRYREALEFYSKRDNYESKHFDPNIVEYMSTIDYDEGKEARQALESESSE